MGAALVALPGAVIASATLASRAAIPPPAKLLLAARLEM
jgi:hypothetical protein